MATGSTKREEVVEPWMLQGTVTYTRRHFIYEEKFQFDLTRIPPASANPYGDGTSITNDDVHHFDYAIRPRTPTMDNLVNEHTEMRADYMGSTVPQLYSARLSAQTSEQLYAQRLNRLALRWEYDRRRAITKFLYTQRHYGNLGQQEFNIHLPRI